MHAPLAWQLALTECHQQQQPSAANAEQIETSARGRVSSDDFAAQFTTFTTISGSPVHLGPMSPLLQPSVASGSSSTTSSSARSPSSRTSSRCQPVTEDDALRSIAQAAMKRVNSISTNAFVKGTWKQRRSQASELVLEHRSASEYRIIAQSMVPCTLDEISGVLSSRSSDHFNAGMIELLGSEFSYGLTVRSVPTVSHSQLKPASSASLTVRALAFGGDSLLSTPLDSEGNYLDYIERDASLRTERRAIQKITRKRGPDGQLQVVAGNSLCSYALHEDQETRQTVILLYGTYSGTSEPERYAATHRFRKLAQLSTKWVQIALRRRLGSQPILDPTADASRSLLELSCVGCDGDFHALFRKRHFCHLCGLHACASCSSVEDVEDVEQELGKIRRLRVCHGCVADVGQELFAKASIKDIDSEPERDSCCRPAEATRPKIRLL
ncbi:hypothetical protein Gpo141_00002819 [Globisporangium polare]